MAYFAAGLFHQPFLSQHIKALTYFTTFYLGAFKVACNQLENFAKLENG